MRLETNKLIYNLGPILIEEIKYKTGSANNGNWAAMGFPKLTQCTRFFFDYLGKFVLK